MLSITETWQCLSPKSIVVGDGLYATTLGAVLGAELLPLERLNSSIEQSDRGGYPLVLKELERVFLVVPEIMLPADAIQCHQSAWNWVKALSPKKEQHDVAFFFILPGDTAADFVNALGVALSLPTLGPATGHGAWRRFDSLAELLGLIDKTLPLDWLVLDRRRTADARRVALARLCAAIRNDDQSGGISAAYSIFSLFERRQYYLELFCRRPRHRHGRLLYSWLASAVTGSVTQEWWETGKEHVANWLA